MSDKTKELMKQRDLARNNAVKNNSQDNWTIYKQLRNKCTTEVKRDKSQFIKSQFENYEKENDVKNLYKTLKNNMGWKRAAPPTTFQNRNRNRKTTKIHCKYAK